MKFTLKDLAEAMKKLEALGDLRIIATNEFEPMIYVGGVEFIVGVKKNFKCGLTADEIAKKIYKICITEDFKDLYILTPDYYLNIPEIETFAFFGESESLRKDNTVIPFGFNKDRTRINLI